MKTKPKTIVDVHPNIILVHQGDSSAAEMKYLTLPEHCQDADGVLDVVLKGLKSQGRRLKVNRFDAAGNPVKK